MAFVPEFKNDVFVSYAHVDDEPMPGAKEGWVTTLIKGLRTGLSQKLGRSDVFELWIDHKLSRNVKITPQIMEMLQQTATLIVILSPGYLASDWCQREADTFLKFIGERVRSGSRVFIVERDKFEDSKRPPEFSELLGYRFWVQDREDSPPRILGFPEPNPDDIRYYDKLNELSTELAKELQNLKDTADRGSQHPPPPKPEKAPIVFLAETTDDLDPVRDDVKRYLDQAGVTVLPDSWYSREPSAFRQAVKNDLGKSDLFVQLLSKTPGKKAPDLPKGIVYEQFECAQNAGIHIMQWHDRKLELNKIHDRDHCALLKGTTVFAVGIEEFKREVVKCAFYKPPQPEQRSIHAFIFVNMDTRDSSLAKKVCNALRQYGADVMLPITTGTPAEIRKDLMHNLLECDALIIIYGEATAPWVREQLRQSRKVIYKRESPLKALAVYEGPPDPKDPLNLMFENIQILNCRQSHNEKIIKKFIDNLRSEENK
jgi:hypothetical protein